MGVVYDDVDLLPGERLLWSGKPERRRLLGAADLPNLVYSAVFLAFAIGWEAIVLANDTPTLFKFWGIPFIAVGLYGVFVQPFVRFINIGSTRYTVTDRRLVEVVDRPLKRRTEVYLRQLDPPVLLGNREDDYLGTVVFGRHSPWHTTFNRRDRKPVPILRDISQPRYVSDLIASAQVGPR